MTRRLFAIAALAIGAAISFAGCKSLPTLQEQFTTACGIVNGDLQTIGTSPLVSPTDQAKIMNVVLPANKTICAAGGGLNVTNLKEFHDSLLPVAVGIVRSTPTLPDQTLILLALNTFGPLVQAQIDMILNAAIPASAPVPASS
jgi:hypothetical protein